MTTFRPESRAIASSVTVAFGPMSTFLNCLAYDRGEYRPGLGKITGDFGSGLVIAFDRFASVEPSIGNVGEVLFAGAWKAAPSSESIVSLMMFLSIVTSLRVFVLCNPSEVYLRGVVRGLSLVSRTKTASSFAGSVLLALRLIEWIAPGDSDQLSPAR